MRISHILNVIGELIRHGLMNFHSTSHASIPVIIICYAASNGRAHDFWRRFRKVRQTLEIVYRLDGSWQLKKSKLEYDERALKKFRTRDISDSLIYTLTLCVPVTVSLHFARLGYDEEDAGIPSSNSSSAAATNRSVAHLNSEGGGRAKL